MPRRARPPTHRLADRWTGPRILTRAGDIWRAEGLKSLWFKILGETVYRRAVLVERPLDEPIVSVTPSVPAVIGLLSEREVEAYLGFRPETEAAEIRRRLERGHVCFVARQEGHIVSAAWIATGQVWVDYLARDLGLAADEAYLYESFTSPGFRGQNIPALLLRLAARLGYVPYYLGRSYRVDELCDELQAAGFRVADTTAILHNPRLMAVAAVAVAGKVRWRWLTTGVQRLLVGAQRLERTRWRYYTGSFVAAKAVRSE